MILFIEMCKNFHWLDDAKQEIAKNALDFNTITQYNVANYFQLISSSVIDQL